MGLWKKSGIQSEPHSLPRGIARLAIAGASLEEICDEVYRTLEPAMRRKVDRFRVWLLPTVDVKQNRDDRASGMRTWSDGDKEDFSEWELSSQRPTVPQTILDGGPSFQQELAAAQQGLEFGLTAGMKSLLWVPVRYAGELQALLLAASKSSLPRFPVDEMERVAAELAVVLGARAESKISQAKAIELAEVRRLWSEIAAGISPDRILQDITTSSMGAPGDRNHRAQFVILGILSGGANNHEGVDLPVDFRWTAGDNVLARSAMGEPIASIWRNALATRTTVGSEVFDRRLIKEGTRVIAIPVLRSGDAVGVLVAGLQHSTASLASLERLEIRASLAAAALAMPAWEQPEKESLSVARFFLQCTSETALILNSKLEIEDASRAGKEFLVASRDSTGMQALHAVQNPENSFRHLFRPPEWPRVMDWYRKVADAGDPHTPSSMSIELRSGRRVRMHGACLAPGWSAVVLQDLASSHRAAENRAVSELHSLIDWIDQGVLLFDEAENLCAVNQRFAQIFGLSPEEVAAGINFRDLVGRIAPHVADPPRFADRWWDAVRGVEQSLREEIQIVQPSSRAVERISRPVFNPNGQRIGRMEIYTDLSVQNLQQAKVQKLERLAFLGQKVSGVAHELSNPLTTILGYAQRLLRKPGGPERYEDLQRIFSEADRASTILRQLLGSVRDSPAERRSIELNKEILRSIELQRFQLAAENIRLELELSSGLPPIVGDSGQLQQILMNLISNSRHALMEQNGAGIIFVRTRRDESGRVLLEVADTGPGIPEAHRHRIFDPFFTTKPAGIGTGLGLPIVMGLVHQNDGNIEVRSLPGEGATFTIDFPPASPEMPFHAPEFPAALSTLPAAPAAASGLVLVVEDEPTVSQLIADMLSDLGYSSEVFQDSRRALLAALNRDYDLVICDMKMPVLDGQHFYRALVEAGCQLASKFLFVTGDVRGLSTQEFLRTHRLPYIAKPFRVEEFTEKVALALRSVRAIAPPPLAMQLGSKNEGSHG